MHGWPENHRLALIDPNPCHVAGSVLGWTPVPTGRNKRPLAGRIDHGPDPREGLIRDRAPLGRPAPLIGGLRCWPGGRSPAGQFDGGRPDGHSERARGLLAALAPTARTPFRRHSSRDRPDVRRPPKSAEIDPKIIIPKSAEIDPGIAPINRVFLKKEIVPR